MKLEIRSTKKFNGSEKCRSVLNKQSSSSREREARSAGCFRPTRSSPAAPAAADMKFRLRRTLQLVVAAAVVMIYINFFLFMDPEAPMADDGRADVMEVVDLEYLHRTQRPDQATFLVNPISSFVTTHNITNISKEGFPKLKKWNVIYPDSEHYADDRIQSQLKFVPEAVRKQRQSHQVKTKKILVYSGLSAFAVKPGKTTFSEQKCEVQDCDLTGDRNAFSTADVVLFQSGAGKNLARKADQIWAIYMLESPYHTPGLTAAVYNWTATYRHDSTIVAPYEKFVPYNSSVDIYGNCGKLRCPRSKANQCFDLLDKDYKFYLSFENSNCRDYITEKFFVNGLKHNVIPIVMGAAPEDYARAAPPHSFIHVDDFESPKHLAEYLNTLDKNDALYNEYFRQVLFLFLHI
ncbi:glycoprotein 3-alpha-l-fucosyltransferase a [Plakobranchus ocellatus]|uniref:Fucosyltransferase n=1 Tax=Plakobranchus ocellatus TaxID=259542 RepID=A0AAV4E2N0_9GAST|nr:glycoprotein 3-alpha-l-fucosyltransferase a [Plakobranchus ocellatus]